MAKSVVILSDISGAAGAKTRDFSIGTDAYEIDLTNEEFAALQDAVAPYVASGRKVRRGSTPVVTEDSRSVRRSKSDVVAIKAWGAGHGFQIPERGRLPYSLIEAYEQANQA